MTYSSTKSLETNPKSKKQKNKNANRPVSRSSTDDTELPEFQQKEPQLQAPQSHQSDNSPKRITNNNHTEHRATSTEASIQTVLEMISEPDYDLFQGDCPPDFDVTPLTPSSSVVLVSSSTTTVSSFVTPDYVTKDMDHAPETTLLLSNEPEPGNNSSRNADNNITANEEGAKIMDIAIESGPTPRFESPSSPPLPRYRKSLSSLSSTESPSLYPNT
jgi:hypothetical protein